MVSEDEIIFCLIFLFIVGFWNKIVPSWYLITEVKYNWEILSLKKIIFSKGS